MFRIALILSLLFTSVVSASIFTKRVPVRMNSGSLSYISIYSAALKQGVPKRPLDLTKAYFDAHKDIIKNQAYVSIIDLSIHSSKERWFLLNMKTGKVEKYVTSHGRGSDANHDGMAEKFSNVPRSQASSVGFYLTDATYMGSNGYSLRLDGLSATNSNARARAIVVHGASYVQKGLSKMGRSLGCPALETSVTKSVIDRIKADSLMLIYSQIMDN